MTKFSKKRMYEELCVTDYDDQVCKEFAENEDLHRELQEDEEEWEEAEEE